MIRPDIIERRAIYSGYISVERVRFRLAGGVEIWRDVERHGAAAAILPYDPDRACALMVRQFRAPVFLARGEAELEEACAGEVVEEAPQAAARREALEELGVLLHGLERVACVWSSPGVSEEQVSLYLAPYGRKDLVQAGGGLAAEHEDIQVVERSLKEIARDADRGRLADMKLLVLIQTLRLRRPDLFLRKGAAPAPETPPAEGADTPITIRPGRPAGPAIH